jgi:hypothetical protein
MVAALVVGIPAWLAFLGWHLAGYRDGGRYERWAKR